VGGDDVIDRHSVGVMVSFFIASCLMLLINFGGFQFPTPYMPNVSETLLLADNEHAGTRCA